MPLDAQPGLAEPLPQPEPQARPEVPPSPSPPPKAPIALTPGPRATALITLYNNALANTLKAVSYESFEACFPEIGVRAPKALRALHGGMVSNLEGFAKDHFQDILTERNVVENLNKLEDLIADAKRRKARSADSETEIPIPPHTLPPTPLLKSHLLPIHKQQQSQLNAKLQTTQSQNASLMLEIEQQRREIEELLRGGEKLVSDLEGAGERLGERGEELETEAGVGERVLVGME